MPQINIYHHPDFLNANGPLGYERTPQLPLDADPVMLAAAVEGGGELTALLSVNGAERPAVAGQFVREHGGRRFFTFGIGSFGYGSRVEYRFEAGGETSRTYGFVVSAETEIASFAGAALEDGSLALETGDPFLPRLYFAFTQDVLVLAKACRNGQGALTRQGAVCRYSDGTGGRTADIDLASGAVTVAEGGRPLLKDMRLALRHTPEGLTGFAFRYDTACTSVYGLGERYDSVDHIGKTAGCRVVDNYTNQGSSTYFPLPFYYGDDGHGVFVDTPCVSEFDFGSSPGRFAFGARIGRAGLPDIRILFGEPAHILNRFSELAGRPQLPPRWAFGVWMSANRWNRQRHIEEQLEEARAAGYPADVVVIEAWSDEATFYIWNDAEYDPKPGAKGFSAGEFRFPADGRWPDPQGMIDRLHEAGIRLVLWQIPVLKKLGGHEPANAQHAGDIRHAVSSGLCALDRAGGAYAVPDFWFSGSPLPDFTQRRAREWWFEKRKYLLAMGVDGFKTDGGEFAYDDDCTFGDGSTGIEMKNGFISHYLDAYAAFAGGERVLFSRAGYLGAQRHPFHWAGDQRSTWQELRAVLNAGLSAGMSGVAFWSFDIAGFAGPLPTAELYVRATQLAAFAPAMQWHSDYMTDQPDHSLYTTGVNDRSPWNVARAAGDPAVMTLSLFYAWLHENLLPHLYSEAQKSAASGLPMMRHLILNFPDDTALRCVDDEFMLGGLLVAPIVEAGARARDVTLPEGMWMDVWTGGDLEGGRTIRAEAPRGKVPLYLRHGEALALALGPDLTPGRPFDRRKPVLAFLPAGETGCVEFFDDTHIKHAIGWDNSGIHAIIGTLLDKMSLQRSIENI